MRNKILEWANERGAIRPQDIPALGATRGNLYPLVASGQLRRVARGLYTPTNAMFTESHTLVEAVKTQSKAVVCLLSALQFHNLGTQIPYETWLAIPYGTRIARNPYPQKRITVLRPHIYEAGIEVHMIEGIEVPIYGAAKTIADCFKFRNKIGVDVAIEALREAISDRRCHREEIRRYAILDRVDNVMRPYLEALS